MYSPYSPGTIYLGRYGTGPSGSINGGTVTTGTTYMLEYVFNGTGNTISFYQSGTVSSSGIPQFTYSAGGSISLIGSYGGGGYLQGQIYEMIVYNTALTNNQRQSIEGYLAWKWGITLVNTHPYYSAPPLQYTRGAILPPPTLNVFGRLPPIVATGGTITFSGAFKIHTFTTVGTTNFVVSKVLPTGFSVQLLVVAGGGAGSGDRAAGGGAGGLIFTTTNLVLGTYPVVVGDGGTVGIGNVHGTNGLNSSFNGQVAIGGGSGGSHFDGAYIGNTGGSGGGGTAPNPSIPTAAGGSGTVGQGFGGGTGYFNTGTQIVSAGGGGGAGGLGSNATTGGGGNGGPGLLITIGGNSAYYAGGGGGAASQNYPPVFGGLGGIGGGGTADQSATINATPGTPNTGGGGAGAGNYTWGSNASNGGSGIVIIAYNYS